MTEEVPFSQKPWATASLRRVSMKPFPSLQVTESQSLSLHACPFSLLLSDVLSLIFWLAIMLQESRPLKNKLLHLILQNKVSFRIKLKLPNVCHLG